MINQLVLLLCLGIGAVCDIRTRRIPNWLVLSGLAFGLVSEEQFLTRVLLSAAICFPLFVLRMTGAGDIKLVSLIAGYLGFSIGLYAVGLGLILGAAASLIKLLSLGIFGERILYFYVYIRQLIQTKQINAYFDSGRDGYQVTIPFAACLFAGSLLVCLVGTFKGGLL